MAGALNNVELKIKFSYINNVCTIKSVLDFSKLINVVHLAYNLTFFAKFRNSSYINLHKFLNNGNGN